MIATLVATLLAALAAPVPLAARSVAISAGVGAGYGLAGVRLEAPIFDLGPGTLSPYVALMPGRFNFDGTEPPRRYAALGARWIGERRLAPVFALNLATSFPSDQALVSTTAGCRVRLGPAFVEAGAGPAVLLLRRSAVFGSGARPLFDVDLGLGVEL